MKNYYIEKNIDLTAPPLKPGWIKKTLSKGDDGICAFESPFIQIVSDKSNSQTHISNCLHIISEHKSVSQKEAATFMECLFLIINNVLESELIFQNNTITLDKKLLGYYQMSTRFRSGLIHVMLFNTALDDDDQRLLSLCDYDLNAKSVGLNIIQKFNSSISNIQTYTK